MANAFLYGVGGGKSKQEKEVVITENGTVEVLPDSGKSLSKVYVSVGLSYVIDGVSYVLNDDGTQYIVESINNDNAAIASNIDNIPVDISTILGVSYVLNSDSTEYSVDSCDTSVDSAIIVYKINNIPVTSIDANAFKNRTTLTSVVISDSVTSIGEYAFSGCSSLTNVIIPDSVTNIGKYAFMGCVSFTTITIPKNVVSLCENAFGNCYNVNEINYNATEVEDVIVSASTPFTDVGTNTSGVTVTIGANVKNIPNALFYTNVVGCSQNVTSVIFEEGSVCTRIGGSVFCGCTGLTEIILPDSVTEIGSSAFRKTGLTSVVIPDCVTSIGADTFCECEGLESITVATENTAYYSAGNCLIKTAPSRLVLGCKNSEIPNGIIEIGHSAFYGCTGLTSITFPSSITKIGTTYGSAFDGCTDCSIFDFSALTAIPTISTNEFNNTPADKQIIVPDNLYDSWIVAANWSTYADNIVKASEVA